MKLIVNADDFGLSAGVNWGIADACQHGIVRSATIMAQGRAFDEAVAIAKENPGLGVGVHLVLTWGQPLIRDLKTIADENGNFYTQLAFLDRIPLVDPEEIMREYRAQIEKVIQAGIQPTHLDTHHHMHWQSVITPIFLSLAKEYGLPVRRVSQEEARYGPEQVSTQSFSDGFYGKKIGAKDFLELISTHKDAESLEIMSHPAFLDHTLRECSSYALPRVDEHETLTCPKVLEFVETQGIQLANFGDI